MNNEKTPNRFVREPARRVFAFELRDSGFKFRDEESEKSPVYVMLPTGERCNRILLCGELMQKDKKGADTPIYLGRVRDPTGLFFVSAGVYQPEAMQQFSKIEPGVFVSVIGKPSVREMPDGRVFVSVRIESINEVDAETYRIWVDDTAEKTLKRIESFGSTEDSRKAKEFYSTDVSSYTESIQRALGEIGF